MNTPTVRSTTVLAVRREGQVAMGADGQVTVGELVMKAGARKVRRVFHGDVLVGFSGATADAFALFERFERQLAHASGNVRRASVDLAREWRTDRYLRDLEAWLLVGSREGILVLSGTGDVIEPDDELAAIGSGGPYAQAAARALLRATSLPADEIVRLSLETAGAMCIYTNTQITLDVISFDEHDDHISATSMGSDTADGRGVDL